MQALWGEILPVPDANVVVLRGGETLSIGDRSLEVKYTPGHASHHVSYFDPVSRVAFVGDTAGLRQSPSTFVLPPTPPPDIDVEAWQQSVATIAAWEPETVFITHFGPFKDVARHLSDMLRSLRENVDLVHASLSAEGTDDEKATSFAGELRRRLRQEMSAEEAERYGLAAPFEFNYHGLARYVRKRAR